MKWGAEHASDERSLRETFRRGQPVAAAERSTRGVTSDFAYVRK